MAWTDTCKIEAVNQVKRLEKEAGGVRAAIRRLSEESGIPYSTLDQWVYPRKQSDAKINVTPTGIKNDTDAEPADNEYIPPPGCGLAIFNPTAKIWFALIIPHKQPGFYFRTYYEKDDFDGGSVCGDTRGRRADRLNKDRLFPPGCKKVVLESGSEFAGPWSFNMLMCSSIEEYRAKRLGCEI